MYAEKIPYAYGFCSKVDQKLAAKAIKKYCSLIEFHSFREKKFVIFVKIKNDRIILACD